MKLKELGIAWINDSSIYVADISLYQTPEDFLTAVIAHVQELLDDHDERECGWCQLPEYDNFLPLVNFSYMRHQINSNERDGGYGWQQELYPGPGHRKVWIIDFSQKLPEEVMRRMLRAQGISTFDWEVDYVK